MKYNIARTMPPFVSLVALFAALVIPARIAAQGQPQQYTVTDLGTLGGAQSFVNGISNRGWVTGAAELPGGQNEHAFLWVSGPMTDLGTLGGPSSLAWGPANDRGEIAGSSETSSRDPFQENFCNIFIDGVPKVSDRTCRGFTWRDGVVTVPPTLGGNNSEAFAANNRGQVVGLAENSTQDPTCIPPQVFDWEAVIWGPKQGEIQELDPFPGDAVAAAIAINDSGQVVGASGVCATPSPAIAVHALLWQDGSVTDLGNFGGVMNNVAFAINERGQIVGSSDLVGDTTSHAFLWQDGVITDLGTLPGDFSSIAFGINSKGQVVGVSCDASGNCRAFLWQKGVMTDLNTLIPPNPSLHLANAVGINDRGEIAGIACVISNGTCTIELPAFLATPTGAVANPVESPKLNLPDNVRKLLEQRRGFGRFGVGTAKP